jgi:protein gp37
MNKTDIEWTDFTSNPWRQKCKKKCWYCYAWKYYPRFGYYSDNPELDHNELVKIVKRKKPAKIFMGSMTDLLGEWVRDSVIHAIICTAKISPQHTFQFLTKNPKRYLEFDWPENCWLGATATNQKQWDEAIRVFNKIESDNKLFISCEPLLENIKPHPNPLFIDWLIIGAITGDGTDDFLPDKNWIMEIIEWWRFEDGPLFLKDNLNWHKKIQEFPR